MRDPIGYVDGLSCYEYVGGSPLRYIDPTGERKFPDGTCGDGCCCCPIDLDATSGKGWSNGGPNNREIGRKISFTMKVIYKPKSKRIPQRPGGEDCSLDWYEWSSDPIWYSSGKKGEWLNYRDYPQTIDSEVFDDWAVWPRPEKCKPPVFKTFTFVDKPNRSNVPPTYRANAFIALRVRASFSCDCKTDNLYLIVALVWRGDNNPPTFTKNKNKNTLLPTPGLPHPHW